MNRFAEVIVGRKMSENFGPTLTYEIPDQLNDLEPGHLIEIPFRKQKLRAVIHSRHNQQPAYSTRKIFQKIIGAPHLSPIQFDLLNFLSSQHFTPLQKCLKLLLPPNFLNKKKFNSKLTEKYPSETDSKFKYIEPDFKLTEDQKLAIVKIENSKKQTVLIHGVTGSGKTEIYCQLAKKYLEKNQQVLILIPEISLTPQTVNNFQRRFGKNIAIIHSHLTAKQKENYWYKIFNQETGLIIGSRSAIFAPFQNLGLIIIDEEHEDSYKQDQSPRYHAREIAQFIAEKLNIKVILGSATPSIESYYKAKTGQYELVEMSSRISIEHQNTQQLNPLPKITLIDLREELKKRNFSIFSETLQQKIAQNLKNQQQTILFLNRRGSSTAVVCRDCGHTETCPHCDISLTYHKKILLEDSIYPTEKLLCHHCSRVFKIPSTCKSCESPRIRYLGLGTQKIEEETQRLFPDAKILRADRDTIKKADDFEQLFNSFKSGAADILIGTQMIAKGLHLPNVTLVGIILADSGLTIPDFRSNEKSFQLLTQVSGRAGRQKPGEVIIQTYQPDHYAIQATLNHDYQKFYQQEIAHRKELDFPPFSKFLKITIAETTHNKAYQQATDLFQKLNNKKEQLEIQNLEISLFPALIPKLKNKYRWHILLSGANPHSFFEKFYYQNKSKNDIRIDVNPLSIV